MTEPLDRLREMVSNIGEKLATYSPDELVQRVAHDTELLETELKLQQLELVESHARLETLREHYFQMFEFAPVAFVHLSPRRDIVEANEQARRMLGIETATQRARSIFNVLHTTDPAALLELIAEGGRGRFTIREDAKLIDIVARRLGTEDTLIAMTDVTELEDARARRREADERFAAVVEQMADALVVVDERTGEIVDHNKAFARLVGSPPPITGLLHEAFFAPVTRAVHTLALRQATPDVVIRVHYAAADGSERITDVSTGRISTSTASLAYHVVRDVTQTVRAEQERRAVEERLAEIQKLEALGLLAAGVAHDMNNILAVVLATTEGPLTPETIAELRTAALRGRGLTERLLSVSRKKPLRTAPFDLLQVIREAALLAQRTFPKGITISLQLPEGTWLVQGDSNQWVQALLNLAINARDALAGTGTLQIAARVEGDHHVIDVLDDGAGMEPEVVRRAFEPFFTTKREGEGSGLGLAHVRAIVAAHGGEVRLSSIVGQGTRVCIELPTSIVYTSVTTPPVEAPRTKAASLEGKRILVVDDDPSVGRSTTRVIKKLGAEATFVDSAQAAIEVMREHLPDLVVTDRSMPKISGIGLSRCVRCHWPELPVVLVTGLSAVDGEDLPVDVVLAKPFSAEELRRSIVQALERGATPPRPARSCTSCEVQEICWDRGA